MLVKVRTPCPIAGLLCSWLVCSTSRAAISWLRKRAFSPVGGTSETLKCFRYMPSPIVPTSAQQEHDLHTRDSSGHLANFVGRQSSRSGGGPARKPFHDFPDYGTSQDFFKCRVQYFLVVPHCLAKLDNAAIPRVIGPGRCRRACRAGTATDKPSTPSARGTAATAYFPSLPDPRRASESLPAGASDQVSVPR
jgi:hypothetical protein